MTSSRLLVIAFAPALVAGCYINDPTPATTYPQQPQVYYGPPGGGMDPSYAPQGPGYSAPGAQYNTDGEANSAPQSYDDESAQTDAEDPGDAGDPNAQVVDPDGPTGPVTDTEIDTTLDGYGSWDDDGEYGRVWVPDATVVGADFTPYESCGSWVWTDYGWTFSCDWDWGWLPFHYGNWVWCDGGYWGWVPGHRWSPAWVDWRYGGGYIGWRPHGPHIRDHRHPERDHASQWRFSTVSDFSRPHIRSHLYRDPAEGLRVTQPVPHPQVHPAMPAVKAASLMRARFANPTFTRGGGPSIAGAGGRPMPVRPGRTVPMGDRQDEVTWRPHPTYQQPTWQRPVGAQPAMTGYRPPAEGYRAPVQTYRPPMQTYRPPMQTYRPPVYAPSGGFHPAAGGGFHPSGGGFHPSSFGGGGGFHPSGGGFHPSGGGGMHFGGGGGRHR